MDTAGKTLNFKGGGRKGNEYAPLTSPLDFGMLEPILYSTTNNMSSYLGGGGLYPLAIDEKNQTVTVMSSNVAIAKMYTGEIIANITAPSEGAISWQYSAYSDYGNLIFLTGGSSSNAYLSIRNGNNLQEISKTVINSARCIAVSPTGKYVCVTGNDDAAAMVYNHLGNLVYTIQQLNAGSRDYLAINDDGIIVVVYNSSFNLLADIYTSQGAVHTTKTLFSGSYDKRYDVKDTPVFIDNSQLLVKYTAGSTYYFGKFAYSGGGLSLKSTISGIKSEKNVTLKHSGFIETLPFLIYSTTGTGIALGSTPRFCYVPIESGESSGKEANRMDYASPVEGMVTPSGIYLFVPQNGRYALTCYRGVRKL